MKNTLPVVSTGRQPRGLVQINGVSIPWRTAEVDNNTFYQADEFRVQLPLSTLPVTVPLDLLFGTADLFVEVFMGFPADRDNYTTADLTSFIYGKTDIVTWDLTETEIELSGRDLTSTMIDKKSVAKFNNQTSSQVVTKIAQENGLTPVVTKTATLIGRYYEIDHVRSQDDVTQWDLITWLAREEGFVAYVQGKSLYFQPAPTETQDPYVFQWTQGSDGPSIANAVEFKIGHSKTLAKDITVKVHSWHRKSAKAVTGTAKASHTASGIKSKGSVAIAAGTPQVYEYIIPNLDKGQADARAQQLLAEISKHELTLEIEGPADNILQRTDVIQVTGTGSALDCIYYPRSITRTMEFEGGYTWRVEAKNHSPETQTVA